MRRIICLVLSVIMIISMVGCSSHTEIPPYEHKIINENENDGIKIAKSVHNQLIDLWNENMGIIQVESNPNNIVRTTIVREDGNEIMYSSDISYLAIKKKNGENYIYTSNNKFKKIDEPLPRLITDVYKRYITLIQWVLEDTNKYAYSKNVNDDNTISHYFTTNDYNYYIEKYKTVFDAYQMMTPYNKCFELALTVDLYGKIVQIDLFATSQDETMSYEMATQFTTDINTVYSTMGDGIKDIWKTIP